MRLFTILTTILASAASAVVLPRQSEPGGTFNVSNFYVTGSPHSIQILYEFNVTDGLTSTFCRNTTSTGPYISSVGRTCCGDEGCDWNFSFEYISDKAANGYVLNITNISPPTSHGNRDSGWVFFNSDKIVLHEDPFGNPNGDYQYLNASESFAVDYYVTYWWET